MNYTEMIEYFHAYRLDKITKLELACVIGIWQRANGYEIIDRRKG